MQMISKTSTSFNGSVQYTIYILRLILSLHRAIDFEHGLHNLPGPDSRERR